MSNQHALEQRRKTVLTQRQKDCKHPDHRTWASKWKEREPGMYEHVCPNCDRKTYFTIPGESG